MTTVQRSTAATTLESVSVQLPDAAYERAAGRAAGYTAGWSAGAQAAQAAGRREMAAHLDQAERATAAQLARLATAVAALERSAEQAAASAAAASDIASESVLDIALRLAAAVLGHEPVASTTPGRDALLRALTAAPAADRAVVRLNAADAATLDEADVPVNVQVVADASVKSGDAVLQHDLGRVEVLLAEALVRARAVLLP